MMEAKWRFISKIHLAGNPSSSIPFFKLDLWIFDKYSFLWSSRKECYELDALFHDGGKDEDEEKVSKQIFEKEVNPLIIEGIFKGINATVLAFGATGSGKTFTMQVCFRLLSSSLKLYISIV